MRKKYFAAGGQIKEQKQAKKPKTDREYKNYVSIRTEPEADRLTASLEVPLPREQSDMIVELYDYGWLRSDIAKEVGLPKTRVNHELFKRKGGGAA